MHMRSLPTTTQSLWCPQVKTPFRIGKVLVKHPRQSSLASLTSSLGSSRSDHTITRGGGDPRREAQQEIPDFRGFAAGDAKVKRWTWGKLGYDVGCIYQERGVLWWHNTIQHERSCGYILHVDGNKSTMAVPRLERSDVGVEDNGNIPCSSKKLIQGRFACRYERTFTPVPQYKRDELCTEEGTSMR